MEDPREERPRRDRLSTKTLFPRVLVVDDNLEAAEAVLEELRRACIIGVATDTPVGVAERLIEERANVLVVSRHMALLNAERLVPMLREDERLHGLIVVVTVGEAGVDLPAVAEACRANAAVPKGVGCGEPLAAAIRRSFDARDPAA
jgi:CheY-like chemotaxis protein